MTGYDWPHTRAAVRRLRTSIARILFDVAWRVLPTAPKDTTHDR